MYGSFLRQVRTSRGMTQAQLAELVGISQPNLSAYERDRRMPGLDVVNRILLACGYELVAQAGSRRIAAPLPGSQPEDALVGDMVAMPYRPRSGRSLSERGKDAWEVLELAEAFQ